MSSPPRKPGHAALAAPVSSSATSLASLISDSAEPAGGLASGTAALAPTAANPTLPSSDAPPPTALEDATGLPKVQLPSVPLVPTAPSPQAPLPGAPTSNHADPCNKYPRASALPQRSHGPSLLTQALATARGILPSTQPDVSQTNKKINNAGSDTLPRRPKARFEEHPHLLEQALLPGSRDDILHQGDGDSLTPRELLRTGSATSPATDPAITTTALPPSTIMATTTAYSTLDLRDMTPVLRAHREVSSRDMEQSTSLERTDEEHCAQERPNRSGIFPHGQRDVGILISPQSTDSSAIFNEARQDPGEMHAQPRPGKAEPRLASAPPQAWSIGVTESPGGQDKSVEMSITKALTGKEPNVRSRKASHSLRFFREGLPDKAKKKDTRSGSHLRDSGPVIDVVPAIDREGRAFEQVPSVLDRTTPPSTNLLAPSSLAGPSDSYRISESPEDYFLLNRGDVHSGESDNLLSEFKLPDPALRVSDVEKASSQPPPSNQRSKKCASETDEVGDPVEDADDSGEEKISSAVFLPHQGLEPSPELPPLSGGPPKAAQLPRPVSTADDFRPWLVKADELEADDEGEDVLDRIREDKGISSVTSDARSQLDESSVPDELELYPKPTVIPQNYEEHVHEHQLAPSKPLDVIELIPYKHQVGGHTTLWRFSKRAVCKQLNNRENEFYEKVENYHRDLLAFLPRYIGVLNVTFKKQPRRRSTAKRDDGATLERRQAGQDEPSSPIRSIGNVDVEEAHPPKILDKPLPASLGHHRVISQSLQSIQVPVPTVTFVDNQHILPRNLLQPSQDGNGLQGLLRSSSTSFSEPQDMSRETRSSVMRPRLEDRHANSWGATTVNKKLRNEVFNDAFFKRGPIVIQRHRKGHQRPLPRRPLVPVLRPSNSDPSFAEPRGAGAYTADSSTQPRQPRSILEQTESDVGHLSLAFSGPDVKDVTGTSAPEPEILGESIAENRRKRRHSGSALRRKPADVRESRGDLQLFEEADDAGRKGDNENVDKSLANVGSHESLLGSPDLFLNERGKPCEQALSTIPSAATSGAPSPTAEFKKIPRPINPKEAQTQRDSRVEYFLLLEDLTAGMKRPCIMDLKMGTRQYGVDASPKKQKSQQGKCAKTTSRELGVRVCGLQVWDVKSQSYVFRDKYYGRNIKAGEEFQEALTRFLHDGVDYSSVLRHIPTILQKLSQLEVIISRLNGYRFYAASLLMFYDGDPSEDGHETAIEDSTTDFATDTEDMPRRKRRDRQGIDFKMADFANCITPNDRAKERTCPPAHPDEPDRGFLRGLRSLRKYFLKIQQEIRTELGLVSQSRNGRNGSMDIDAGQDEGEVSE